MVDPMSLDLQVLRRDADQLFHDAFEPLRLRRQLLEQHQDANTTQDPGADISSPANRFKVYGYLLKAFGSYTPGIDFANVEKELHTPAENLGDDASVPSAVRERITGLLGEILGKARPTYTVASYMSPLLARRQSVLHRPSRANTDEEEGNQLAHAYAFYDLTFSAKRGLRERPPGREWYSPTQRILEKKETTKRWSLPLCLLAELPADRTDYWHIPPAIQRSVLEAVDIERLLADTLLQNEGGPRDLDELEALLGQSLANPPVSEIQKPQFAERCLARFSDTLLSRLDHDASGYIRRTTALLRRMFGEGEISEEETLYMVLTHGMWSRACPGTGYAYTFPVLLPGFPCVLTMGTKDVLPSETVSALVILATSMFTSPVMVDYAEHVVREKRPLQRRTARAAIMSRNLSHNIGSHALANARFPEAVGVLHLQGSPPTAQEDRRERDLDATHRECETHAGHVCVTKGEIWRAQSRLTSLNGYLQGRLDFIARALGETTSSPEPMFLINDLLKGFLGQTVLLNTLLSDIGFTAKNLEFHVRLPGNEPLVFEPQRDDRLSRHVTLNLRSGTFDDLLVAVPGSMVGRHAFYAFLENIMRNSAKYGSLTENARTEKKPLSVHLKVEEDSRGLPSRDELNPVSHPCYRLTVWDSLSQDLDSKGRRISQRIRKHLDEDIIGPSGETRVEGHGIQEMKVCALFLAGGDHYGLHFPPDTKAVEVGEDGEYVAFLEGGEAHRPDRVDRELNALRCFSKQIDGDGAPPQLAYQMILLRPTLLGIVDPTERRGLATADGSIRTFDSIETLAKEPAAFGLILGCGDKKAIFEKLVRFHVALPYRLMIVTRTEQEAADWSQDLGRWQAERADAWADEVDLLAGQTRVSPFPLPPRRIHVISSNAVFAALEGSEVSPEKAQALVCDVYARWLRAWKAHELQAVGGGEEPPPWHLCIGFDREENTVRSRWLTGRRGFVEEIGFASPVLDVHVVVPNPERNPSYVEITQSRPLRAGCFDDASFRGTALVLDNHGTVFPSLLPGQRFAAYHRFSGSGQAALFQLLENPPREPFARALLLYSLAESLLMNVAVVDERVADSLLRDDGTDKVTLWQDRVDALHGVRLFPVLDLAFGGQDSKPLTDRVRRAHDRPQATLSFDQKSVRVEWISGPRDLDCIVVHEGAVDALQQSGYWPDGLHSALHSICPWVVRTSGRGAASKHLDPKLPFLEFSELSDTTYRQMNKPLLGKALLALRGSVPDRGAT